MRCLQQPLPEQQITSTAQLPALQHVQEGHRWAKASSL